MCPLLNDRKVECTPHFYKKLIMFIYAYPKYKNVENEQYWHF